jgi:hypothetical protein
MTVRGQADVTTTIDATPPPSASRRPRLGSLADQQARLRRKLWEVVGKLEDGTLQPKVANALVFALGTLGARIEKEREQGELLDRLDELEAAIARRLMTSYQRPLAVHAQLAAGKET